MTAARDAFRAARDLLLRTREDYDAARSEFRWPKLDEFNWALDWFDVVATGNEALALWVVEEDGSERQLSFRELSERSSRIANWLRQLGARRGDRMIVMLGNQVELWETVLAATKLGAVVIPATTLLTPSDLVDRVDRGHARFVVTNAEEAAKFEHVPGDYKRIAVGEADDGWFRYADGYDAPAAFRPDGPTASADPLFLYFTSGTTAKPKLVEHTHGSYPVGHLSTMYWIGLKPGDVHLNISSPGWAKHAWSNIYAPWNAEATVLVYAHTRFEARALLEQIVRCRADTFCAPPTVWRMLIQEDLATWTVPLREAVAAGEPLNPEVIERVREAWGITVRDGYGQTETTAQIGNSPGSPVKLGSMGRPLPGYDVVLVDPITGAEGSEGEVSLPLGTRRPLGLMRGYEDSNELNAQAMRNRHYHTGDIGRVDEDGYITYVGRADDVFKASDYRISPFELESVLIQHPACVEAAVVPSPDPVRLAVPKAFIQLSVGMEASPETACAILKFARDQLAPYKRIRRLEFAELPKTISGKIRRIELRALEEERHSAPGAPRAPGEYWEEDFPELKLGRT